MYVLTALTCLYTIEFCLQKNFKNDVNVPRTCHTNKQKSNQDGQGNAKRVHTDILSRMYWVQILYFQGANVAMFTDGDLYKKPFKGEYPLSFKKNVCWITCAFFFLFSISEQVRKCLLYMNVYMLFFFDYWAYLEISDWYECHWAKKMTLWKKRFDRFFG